TLSHWLRDYLYIPLGGNRRGPARTYFNLMVTMLLGGLWHGANWTFVAWGGLHGAYLAVERAFGVDSRASWARRLLTFHLVCFSWIFFRAPTFGVAWEMLTGFRSGGWHLVSGRMLPMLGALVLIAAYWLLWPLRRRLLAVDPGESFAAQAAVAIAGGLFLMGL